MFGSTNVRVGALTGASCELCLYSHHFTPVSLFSSHSFTYQKPPLNFIKSEIILFNLATNHKYTSKAPSESTSTMLSDLRRKKENGKNKVNPSERKKLLRFEWRRIRKT